MKWVESWETQSDTPEDDKWSVNIEILSQEVQFRIDTGAKCNTLTIDSYQSLMQTGELKHSNIVLCSYSNHKVKPGAAVELLAKYKNWETRTEFEMVNIAQGNMYSVAPQRRLWAIIMRLNSPTLQSETEKNRQVAVMDILTHSLPDGLDDFPELSRTIGTLPGTYTIKIDPEAKGVVHPVRCQPAALKEKIVEKLHEMEKDGQIAKVNSLLGCGWSG